MNLICLLYTISAFCNGANLATYSGNLSYDVAEADTFPFPAMLEALYSMSRVPYDVDKTLANDEVTLYINVEATCDGVCEEVEVCDTVTSTIDAVVALYSALNLAAEKLLPGAGGRLA